MRAASLLSLFLLAGLLVGCGSFVGRRYDNFTAYYNTFYNAQRAFETGLKATEKEDEPIDRDVYLPLFSSTSGSAQGQSFNDAIKKSADVLREHDNSKWVDDALMLIGKSYFYLQNYVGAEQKFREVMSLDSPLRSEAAFWMARTLIASTQYDAAAAHLQESLARDDLSRRWAPSLQLALAELAVKQQRWNEAAEHLEQGLEAVRDKELGARAQFLLGQIYETQERYDDAVAAYERVGRFNPLYELSFAAQVSAVRVEGTHGDPERALRWLRRMERDDKNYGYRAELAYLRGRIYQAQGRATDADAIYYTLLYDSDASTGTVAGKTYYALGELYRDLYNDYPLAAAYFDTAASRLGTNQPRNRTGPAPMYAPAAIANATEQQRVFSSFRDVMREINRMDSLLALGDLGDEEFQAFVLELREQRAEELAEQRREQERREAEQRFQDAVQETGTRNVTGVTTTTAATATAQGFLSHRDPVRIQQAQIDFVQRWGDRPLVPNWRRQNALAGAQADARGQRGVAGTSPNQPFLNTPQDGLGDLPVVDVSQVPRTLESRAAMRNARAVARYELGNVLFLSMNRPDSAAVWYRMIIEEDSLNEVSQRAFYALAEVQQALTDTLAARRLYRTILERYPHSDFAGRARERLGLPPLTVAEADTLALAETAYEMAYAVWQRGRYDAALDSLVTVAVEYPNTTTAPKALYAAGQAYLEWAAADSLDLFAPLPLAVPDSVLLARGLLERPPTPDTADTATPLDSLDVQLPDTLLADTLLADSLLADSLSTDSLDVQHSDSLAVPVGSNSETVAPPQPEPLRLETLYASLVERYPASPQAEQARLVLQALEERRPLPPADEPDPEIAPETPAQETETLPEEPSTPEVLPENTPEVLPENEVAPDSTRLDAERLRQREEERQNALQERRQRLEDEAAPAATPPSGIAPRGLGADELADQWVIRVSVSGEQALAESSAVRYRLTLSAYGQPVSVIEAPGGGSYWIVVGRFPDQALADEMRTLMAGDLPPDAEIVQISQSVE